MSKSEVNDDLDAWAAPDAARVLERVARIAGARSDAALSRALGVKPQTLASWRKRGTVPYAEVVRFAETRRIWIEYLILGEGPENRDMSLISASLFARIASELEAQLREAAPVVRERLTESSAAFAGHCAAIHNHLALVADRYRDLSSGVRAEVSSHIQLQADLVVLTGTPDPSARVTGKVSTPRRSKT